VFFQTINKLSHYFQQEFFPEDTKGETTSKIYLIYSFSIIAFVFLFSLGIKGLKTSNPILSTFLLGSALIFIVNIVYLKKTSNIKIAGNTVLYVLSALMLYLLYTGGVEGTGPLWIYVLAPLFFYINGLKQGSYSILIFLMLMSIILYGIEPSTPHQTYSESFKLRFILSFIVVGFLSSTYEYSRETSIKHLQKLRKDLENMTLKDDLTGLYNRRAYNQNLKTIHEIGGSILMCDIDHFKIINDKYGHSVGDFVIQKVAACIQQNIRKEDIAIRWGGEEFFIFLSKLDENQAYLVGEKLREMIENLTIEYKHHTLRITISIGISPLYKELPIEDAIKKSDDAMYVAKDAGRNKTVKSI